MKQTMTAFLAGLLFGAGLIMSTMVDPVKVLGFLDVFGKWDPTLAFVMAGGLSVYLPVYFMLIKPRKRSLLGEEISLPVSSKLDKKLLLGATIFGIGWGISGICPGPAMASITSGNHGILLFVVTMMIGMIAANKFVK